MSKAQKYKFILLLPFTAMELGPHYENTPIQIYSENFTTKNWTFPGKNSDIFSYFRSKHRLCVLVRTARRGGSNEYQQSMFLSRNKKNNVYPCKLQFYCIKVGFKGVKII